MEEIVEEVCKICGADGWEELHAAGWDKLQQVSPHRGLCCVGQLAWE
jgi:hypothetical protein